MCIMSRHTRNKVVIRRTQEVHNRERSQLQPLTHQI